MEYIVHRRFKKPSAAGKRLNLPYGTKVTSDNNGMICSPDGDLICFATSENAKLHFAINDDGQGLERGKLTYAIAYAPRNNGHAYRFSEAERIMLIRNWNRFLRQDTDMILFNEDFFRADTGELRRLADALNIKVRR